MAGKKYHKLDFSSLEDEMLIEKVRENPPLYAKKLKSYKDMKMKDNIWAKIAKEMGESGFNRTGEECKKRWSNLRDYYVRKKKISSTGSAASSQGIEKFDHMKFLDSTAFVHRTTKSNISIAAVADGQVSDNNERLGDGSDIENQNQETENQSITEETLIEETPIDDEDEQIDEAHKFTEPATQVYEADEAHVVKIKKVAGTKRLSDSETRGRMDTKKVRTLQDIEKGRSERLLLLREIAQRNNTSTSSMPQSIEDPVDLFFKSLAATAKTLSPKYLAEAKRKLFLVMAEIEEKNIEEKYSSSNSSPWPEFISSDSSNFPAFVSAPSTSRSLPYSDDSTSACHAIERTEYETHEHPSPPNEPTNQEPMTSSEYTIQSFLAGYTPL